MNLKLSDKLTLPAEAVTQTIGILAKRRAGKSYTARRFAEQLVRAGQQIAIVDPKGDWWGIRYGKAGVKGKSSGLPIVILGGERSDVPLEVGSGEIVAQLVADERVSVLLDLSLFRKHEVATFMTAFLENLYRLKAREQARTPLMLIVDESDAIAPQKPQENEARMLGAAEDIVRRGGQRGIGCTMITQRSAVLNKNVLTQVELLITLRTIAPQDLAAVKAWIDVHGTLEEGRTMMDSLPGLPIGDAWVWSPGWPTAAGIFQRVHVLPIETYDSGATPKPGQTRVEPKNAADVDLAALRTTMAATIERAKADDPRALRREITRLNAELEKSVNAEIRAKIDAAKAEPKIREVPVLKEGQLARVEKMIDRIQKLSTGELAELLTLAREALRPMAEAVARVHAPVANSHRNDANMQRDLHKRMSAPIDVAKTLVAVAKTQKAMPGGEGIPAPISAPQQRILDVLASLLALGLPDVDKSNAAVLADQSPTSSGFANNLGKLRSLGLIAYPQGGRVALTDAGRSQADGTGAIRTREDLHRMWFSKVSDPKRRILEQLIARFPDSLGRSDLAGLAGQSATASGFANNLGNLRSLGLIDYPGSGLVAATRLLFPEGLS